MTLTSSNEIAKAIYILLKDKSRSEQAELYKKIPQFLFKKKLLSKAPDILERLSRIIDKENGKITAQVWSTENLSTRDKLNLKHTLKKRYSAQEVNLIEQLDKHLMGGIKVRVEDEVIDLSVKNKVAKLKEYLTKSL